ncbi:MAG: hypothetical protein KDB11_19645 [Planctomycetales bacterium]|nr:hypothetical protein [Planctomycetales bacterium]
MEASLCGYTFDSAKAIESGIANGRFAYLETVPLGLEDNGLQAKAMAFRDHSAMFRSSMLSALISID